MSGLKVPSGPPTHTRPRTGVAHNELGTIAMLVKVMA